MPGYPAIFNNNRLRGFVSNFESFGNRLRYVAIFDDKNHATGHVASRSGKLCELVVGLAANRTLRAMLENENGIAFRPLQKLFEVSILA
jgi:hypothetical protein